MSYLITIITINLNNKKGLINTINSVIEQTYLDIEYIVIDGGSTDGSIELLNNKIITYSISEKDNGIYHAMNKGISKASGKYCLFLNSGDSLSKPSIIEETVYIMNESELADIYFGNIIINGNIAYYPDVISLEFLLKRSLPHPASFIKTSLFKHTAIGLYNEKYKIVSDWIFFIHAYLYQSSYKKINLPITVFNTEGISSTNVELNDIERESVMKNIFPNLLTDLSDLREMNTYRSSRMHRAVKTLREWLFKH